MSRDTIIEGAKVDLRSHVREPDNPLVADGSVLRLAAQALQRPRVLGHVRQSTRRYPAKFGEAVLVVIGVGCG